MRVVEKYINSKSGDISKCEDGLFYNDHFVVVVDGVTSKEKLSKEGLTGGYIAKEVILNKVKAFDKSIKSSEALNELSYALSKEKHLGVKATVVIYSDFYKEIWIYGNCQIMINGKRKKYETKVDKLFSTLRSFVIFKLLAEGIEEQELLVKDTSREEILSYLKTQSIFENEEEEFGYAVLNGDNDDISKMSILKVNSGDEVIIASDGYPLVYNSLKKSEKYLRDILRKDPLCYKKFKSTKGVYKGNISYDDRTYVKFYID